jgi:hypothetical protein
MFKVPQFNFMGSISPLRVMAGTTASGQEEAAALDPEHVSKMEARQENIPQRLKPHLFWTPRGTTQVVPFQDIFLGDALRTGCDRRG